MRFAQPEKRAGNNSPEARGHGQPPQTTDAEAERLLAELGQATDDDDDQPKKKRTKTQPTK